MCLGLLPRDALARFSSRLHLNIVDCAVADLDLVLWTLEQAVLIGVPVRYGPMATVGVTLPGGFIVARYNGTFSIGFYVRSMYKRAP